MKKFLIIFILVFHACYANASNSIEDSLKTIIANASTPTELAENKMLLSKVYRKFMIHGPKAELNLVLEVIQIIKKHKIKQNWISPYFNAFHAYKNLGMLDSAMYYGKLTGGLYAKNSSSWYNRFRFFLDMSHLSNLRSEMVTSKLYCDSADALSANRESNEKARADLYWSLGSYFKKAVNLHKSIEYFLKAMRFFESIKDTARLAALKHNVANIYMNIDAFEKAEKLYKEAEELNKHYGNKLWLGHNKGSLMQLAYDKKDYALAYHYGKSAMKLYKELGDQRSTAAIYIKIGALFLRHYRDTVVLENSLQELGMFNDNKQPFLDSAFLYFNEAITIGRNIGSLNEEVRGGNGLIHIFIEKKDYESAVEIAERGEQITKDAVPIDARYDVIANLIYAYTKYGDDQKKKGQLGAAANYYKKSLVWESKLSVLKDSILSNSKIRAIAYEATKHELNMLEIKHQNQEHERSLQENARRNSLHMIIVSVSIGALMLVVFLVVLYLRFKKTKFQNKIIVEQKLSIELQHDQLQESNRHVNDSITYASRIQASLLPDNIENLFENIFIYYQPREVVSGDFYWSFENEFHKFLVVADCTGHGVPGAFMSVLGISMLDKIVGQMKITEPNKILAQLSLDISNKLQKEGELMSSDGMDISLIRIDRKSNQLLYCGVGNDLIIQKPGETLKLKAEILPIGHQKSGMDYIDQKVQLEIGDRVFMYTDGFADQFSGDSGKKIGFAKFERLLLDDGDKSMKEIGVALSQEFDVLRGDRQQLDDICVIGVKL